MYIDVINLYIFCCTLKQVLRIKNLELRYVLMLNDSTGKFLHVVQSVYSQLQSCVKTNNGLS